MVKYFIQDHTASECQRLDENLGLCDSASHSSTTCHASTDDALGPHMFAAPALL